ncbi:hypothetical protein Tco_0830381 [Tanacetum coccineum]
MTTDNNRDIWIHEALCPSPTISASPLEKKKRKQTAGESSSPRKSLKITIKQKQIVEKDDDDSEDRIEPGSHKDNLEFVVDDDDKAEEKHSDDIGSLEIRNEETCALQDVQTSRLYDSIHGKKLTPSLKIVMPFDKKYQLLFVRFLMHTVIIEELFKNYVQSNVVHVYPTTTTSTKTESSATLQYQLYLKMKRSLQDRADDIALWEALRRKFKKSSPSNTSCKEDDFHSQHNEHQDDDAPPEGEKRVKSRRGSKRSKSAREENVIDEDEVIPEVETPELIAEFQNVDKRVPTIFDRARMEATLRDSLSNQSRNAEEYAYHLEQSIKFMENQIVWESRQQDILYGNTEERKYVLSLHKIHAEEFLEHDLEEKLNRWVRKEFKTFNKDARSCVIWERVHDFQLGIESYQMKVNLTVPIITFPGIEEHAPYSIVDEPQTGLIYLNSQDEKRLMYLVEIVKFCDATLEKVLNEVKLRMFENRMLKK